MGTSNFDPKDQFSQSQALKVQELSISGSDYQMYNLTVSPSVTITGNTAANPTVVTTSGPHGLITGEYVTITGSNSTPTLNGTSQVTVTSATTFTVAVNVSVAGTTGAFTSSILTVFVNEPVKAVYDTYLKIDASNTMYNFNSTTVSIVDTNGGLSGFNFNTGMQVSNQGAVQYSGVPVSSLAAGDCLVLQYKVQQNLNTP